MPKDGEAAAHCERIDEQLSRDSGDGYTSVPKKEARQPGPEEGQLPKQNRPLVRDGRLQAPKKRTDRSYLGAPPPATSDEPSEQGASQAGAPPMNDPTAAFQAPAEVVSSAGTHAVPASRPPIATTDAAARRRRRDVDPEQLLAQDSGYAMHELRRIAVLAAMVVGTLVALGIFMR